jgi:ATP adenylyltransferase
MKYILSASESRTPSDGEGRLKSTGCFLCDNPNDEASLRETLVLVVQPHAAVCLNRYPFAPGHLLVAPRRHVADLADLQDEEYAAVMALLRDSVVQGFRREEVWLGPPGVGVGVPSAQAGPVLFAPPEPCFPC